MASSRPPAVAPDQRVGRAVVRELGLVRALELGNDALRQHLAQLDAPLIERVDIPDRPLGKDAVLVERDQLPERLRRQALGQNRVGRAIALEDAMRHQPARRSFGFDLRFRLAERQRFGLREQVRHQQVVMIAKRIQRLAEADEVAGNQPRPLMDQLIERMLAVGARLAPVDRPRLIVDARAVERDVLAVALHRQLLEVRGKALQVLLVRQHRDRLRAEEIVVPDREQPHEHRQVALERRACGNAVHRVKAGEHGAEVLRADREHGRQADRRIHRVATADPVPEAEHVGGVDAELRHALGVGRYGDKVPAYRPLVAELAQAPGARRVRVGQRLERRERLGADDEQRLLGIEVARGFREVGAVDVGDEAEGQVAPAVVTQRFVGHHRAEIGAADADVDDVADAADPCGRASGRCGPRRQKAAMRSSTACTSGTTSTPSTRIRSPAGARRATWSTARCSVTLIFSPPNIASMRSAQAALLGQPQQQPDRLVGDAILRVVEVEAGGFGRQALAPPGIVGEELPQMQIAHRLVMRRQRLPRRALGQRLRSAQLGSWSWLSRTRLIDRLQRRALRRRCSPSDPATTCRRIRFPRAGVGRRAPHRRHLIRVNSASTSSASPPSTGNTPFTSP